MRSLAERWPWIVKFINRSYLSAQTELWELPVIKHIRNELYSMPRMFPEQSESIERLFLGKIMSGRGFSSLDACVAGVPQNARNREKNGFFVDFIRIPLF